MPRRTNARYAVRDSLAGIALIFTVLLLQVGAWLAAKVPEWLSDSLGIALPEWAGQLLRVLFSVAAMLLPFLLVYTKGRAYGLRIGMGKARLPMGAMALLFFGSALALNIMVLGLRTVVGSATDTQATLPNTPPGLLVYLLHIIVLAPFCEELLFRGAIHNMLLPHGPRAAVLFTAIMFSLLHTQLWDLPVVLGLALLLGYFAHANGSILPGILLHAGNNLLGFLLLLLQAHMGGAFPVYVIAAMFALSAGCLLVGILGLRRYKKQCLQSSAMTQETASRETSINLGTFYQNPWIWLGMAMVVIYFIINMQI